MASTLENEGVFAHKAKLYTYIKNGQLDDDVVAALVPEGVPISYERQLWDYKLEFPALPVGRNLRKKNSLNTMEPWPKSSRTLQLFLTHSADILSEESKIHRKKL
ncbi:hypothetical protein PQR53_15860 [Paraburkholderia fungorum]|uniref:hypothetical protein n=1 Tax=Paraburkholderia fungorum TaxID=134537 RepID=UPI0038B939F2